MSATIFEKKWWYGGPWDLWINNVKVIGDFVRKQQLKPVEVQFTPMTAGATKAGIIPKPFPGGIRVPHLHWKEGLYMLNDQQWKTFSAGILTQYQAKLAKVGSVGFEQLMDVSAGVETLG
jgi:hypothetical protein